MSQFKFFAGVRLAHESDRRWPLVFVIYQTPSHTSQQLGSSAYPACRLPFVRRMMTLYQGPISLAVYIPEPESGPTAAQCRDRSIEYIRASVEHLRNGPAGHTSNLKVSVSLLYANSASPSIHCNLSEASTGLEESWTDSEAAAQLAGRGYLAYYDAEYPVGALRQLALDAVCSARAHKRPREHCSLRRAVRMSQLHLASVSGMGQALCLACDLSPMAQALRQVQANVQVPEDRFAYLVDADFVFPANFASSLTSGRSAAQLQALRAEWAQRGQRGAMVIPAFERLHNISAAHPAGCALSVADIEANSSCRLHGEYDVPLTKAKLRSMVETDQSVAGFFAKRVRDRRCHVLPVSPGLSTRN